MDGGAWWAAVHGIVKSRTQLSDFTFTFHFHALEKEMATHPSALAWRIPGKGNLAGCRLWGLTESDTTEATQQQQQQQQATKALSSVLSLYSSQDMVKKKKSLSQLPSEIDIISYIKLNRHPDFISLRVPLSTLTLQFSLIFIGLTLYR